MKWPWVSRLAYETLERERNSLARLLDDVRREHQELVGDVVDMKRDGFTAAPTYPVPPAGPQMADEISEALDTLHLHGTLRYQMGAWAERQIAKGRKPDEVARDLLAGGQSS